VGAIIEILLCSGFPTQILLLTVLTGFGLKLTTSSGHLNPPFIFALSLIDAVLVVGLVVMFLRAHRESPRAVLFGRPRHWRDVLLGIGLLPAAIFLIIVVRLVVLKAVPWLHNVPRNPLEDMLTTTSDAMIFAVVVTVAGGVREEVQRGFILTRFDQYLGGARVGLIVWSILFGFGHLDQGYDATIATALLGMMWGAVYLGRRSIVAPMVSHACFNLTQLLGFVMLARPA
jgi:membrane protease YdiL (CAAX protease family)